MRPSISGTAIPAAPATAAAGAHRTARLRRIGVGLALIVAPWGLLIANAGYAWATRHGGSDETGAKALALVTPYPGLFRVVLVAAMLGCLLLIPAVLAGMRLTRTRAPWLSLAGGTLMIAGYVCYLGILASNVFIIVMAEVSGPADVFARVIDQAQGDATAGWLFGLFVLGNIAGTALFVAALLRSRAVPTWAAIAVLAWPALHIVGLAAGSEWFEVVGALLQAAGFAALGVAVLRTADHQWEPLPSHPSSVPVITTTTSGPQARPGFTDLMDQPGAGERPARAMDAMPGPVATKEDIR